VSLVVRTWNLFHGNSLPPGRRTYLEPMVRLAAAGADVVCLQEVPAWAVRHLGAWSGMQAAGAVAARPRVGPLPSTAEIGHRLTSVHPGVLRSAFSGQANAILVSPRLRLLDTEVTTLNPRRFRRAQADRLGLDPVLRLAWAKERRVCQALRLELPEGGTAWVANLHATSLHADERVADAELRRAAEWIETLAWPGEPVLLCGDMNVTPERSRTLRELATSERGYSAPAPGRIDQVLVRGLDASAPAAWPLERRRLDGVVASDHAPVEVTVG
jgi:endonuclease/exonuclease/phosphatase family metal-dependent hydrolase